MTKLSIIILNYNTKDLTTKCIRSVLNKYQKEISSKEFEIIVVDNASSDGSVQTLEKIGQIALIRNNQNLGFSKGCNIGARKARGEYLLFLNSDTRIEDNGFSKMLNFLEDSSKVGILGGKLLNPDGTIQPSSESFYSLVNLIAVLLAGERVGLVRRNPKNLGPVDAVSGASLMIRKKLFEKMKGFDEHFFMYMEDMELCFRAKKLGYLTYFYPDIKLIHKELGSSNRGFAVNQIYRGLLYFYRKHKPYWQYLLIKILLIIKALIAVILGGITNNSYLKKTYTGALKFTI